MKKFYAVRMGRNPGIYEEWSEAEKQIKGFSGAVFKKFPTKEEALGFVSMANDENTHPYKGIKIFTDGSFDQEKNCYGWGFIVTEEETVIGQQMGSGDKVEYLSGRQVAGETIAVLRAVDYALAKGYTEIEINYDYAGIEMWALGDWKAKSPIAIDYVKELNQKAEKIDVYFNKIKAHKGNEFNELADKLAKTATDNH